MRGFIYAEREGFEPPVPFGTIVFKTTALNRSAISPKKLNPLTLRAAKVKDFLSCQTTFALF